MKRAERPTNKYYIKGQIMEELVRKSLIKYKDQHIGYMTNAEISKRLEVNESTISRKLTTKDKKGHSLFISDLFEWCELIGVSPVEILASAMLEYEVNRRMGVYGEEPDSI